MKLIMAWSPEGVIQILEHAQFQIGDLFIYLPYFTTLF